MRVSVTLNIGQMSCTRPRLNRDTTHCRYITFLKQLKANNANWIKLFRKKRIRVNKGALGAAFFTAQKQIISGAQPTICVQNNVILNTLSQHKKHKSVPYSKHLQDKVDKKVKSKNRK
eukprot:404316_1